jgi:phage tail-like protein
VAEAKSEQRVSYPLAAYNFRVTVNGAAMRFAKVSGLQREHQTLIYRHGLSFVEGEQIAKYHVDKYTTVTFEQGTVIGSTFLHEWLEQKTNSTMEISLCDEQGLPVIGWRIAKAVPVKLSASNLDARTNEVAVETLEVKAAGVFIVHLS